MELSYGPTGVEREYPDAKLDGITLFTNSFGQPTVYAYPWGGASLDLGGVKHLSFSSSTPR